MQAEGDRLTAERIMLHKSRADMAAQLARLKAIQARALLLLASSQIHKEETKAYGLISL